MGYCIFLLFHVYIANAYFLTLGYKVGHKIAHKITADTLIVLVKDKFKHQYLKEYELAVEEALSISENLVENFDFERIKHSRFQYMKQLRKLNNQKQIHHFKEQKNFLLKLKNYWITPSLFI